MKLIDADELFRKYLKGNIFTAQTDYAQGARDIIEDMLNAPTIDAVRVVRCKDCKYYAYAEKHSFYVCQFDRYHRRENDFCSSGARKDEID